MLKVNEKLYYSTERNEEEGPLVASRQLVHYSLV